MGSQQSVEPLSEWNKLRDELAGNTRTATRKPLINRRKYDKLLVEEIPSTSLFRTYSK